MRDDVREYLEIAVLSVALRAAAKPERLAEPIHRAVPNPVLLPVVDCINYGRASLGFHEPAQEPPRLPDAEARESRRRLVTQSSPDSSLQMVPPALLRIQIQVLLRELRAEGLIHSVGKRKAARWYPEPVARNCNHEARSSGCDRPARLTRL